MPVNYPIPPWAAMRAPPNPAEAYIQNLRLGVEIGQQNQRIAQEQKRLQQNRELAEMQIASREKEQEQRALREEQKLEMERARNEAEQGLKQQQLDEAKKLTDAKVQQAALQFQATQRVQAAVAGGEDPAKAMFREAAGLRLPAGDLRAVMQANQPPFQPSLVDVGGGEQAMQVSPGRYVRVPRQIEKKYGPVKTEPLPDGGTAVYREGSPGVHVLKRTDTKPKLSLSALASLAKSLPDLIDEAKRAGPGSPQAKLLEKVQQQLNEADENAPAKKPTHRWDPKLRAPVPVSEAFAPATDDLASDEGEEIGDDEEELETENA